MTKQPISNSALINVDIQDSFLVGPRWENRSNPDFEANVSKLLAAYRDAALPVIFMLHTDSDPGFRRNDEEFRLMDFMQRRENEPILVKDTYNSFTSTDLHQRLQALGVKRILVTGMNTEQCCETTARVGCDLGYDVDFIMDATRTFPITNSETGDVLSTGEIIRRTEFVLRNRFARITSTESITTELAESLQACSR